MPSTSAQIIAAFTTPGQTLEQQIITLAEKVRDIPYGNIGSRDPLDVFTQNKGTCSGKHELLKLLYHKLNIPTQDFLTMHHFKDLPIKFPPEIQTILDRTDITDPHNYFKINRDNHWLTVDITWDKPLQKLGFPVTENWDGKSNMPLAVVASGQEYITDDPITLKKQLISKLPELIQKDRMLFLDKCTQWLDNLRTNHII